MPVVGPFCESKTNLCAEDGKDGLSVDEVGVAEVAEASALEDLGAGPEPDSLTELGAVLGQDLRGDAAESAKHGPAGMDDLGLAGRLVGLGVSGETSSVLQQK